MQTTPWGVAAMRLHSIMDSLASFTVSGGRAGFPARASISASVTIASRIVTNRIGGRKAPFALVEGGRA